ncbi:MAG: NlpC/P60 family protein [Kiloniellaceae bacterium]
MESMPDLDPRVHAFRPDLAAESLKGRVEAARYAAGTPAQVARGIADLRRAPGASAGLDSQLLSREVVTVYDEADGWAWVQNRTDGYVGYVEADALARDIHPPTHSVRVPRTFVYPEPDLKAPPLDSLTMTGRVAVAGREGDFSAVHSGGGRAWVYRRHLAAEADIAPDYVATALQFLGTPYLWGGKGSLGLDCSGLIQVALARAGIACPRDTDMQAASLGAAVARAPGQSRPRRGDIVYFPGHVAIALDETRVVSANAHAMMVSVEPLSDLEARVKVPGGGPGIAAVRRPVRSPAPLASAKPSAEPGAP